MLAGGRVPYDTGRKQFEAIKSQTHAGPAEGTRLLQNPPHARPPRPASRTGEEIAAPSFHPSWFSLCAICNSPESEGPGLTRELGYRGTARKAQPKSVCFSEPGRRSEPEGCQRGHPTEEGQGPAAEAASLQRAEAQPTVLGKDRAHHQTHPFFRTVTRSTRWPAWQSGGQLSFQQGCCPWAPSAGGTAARRGSWALLLVPVSAADALLRGGGMPRKELPLQPPEDPG